MNKNSLREEWNKKWNNDEFDSDYSSIKDPEKIWNFMLSKLDTYADAKLAQVAEEVEKISTWKFKLGSIWEETVIKREIISIVREAMSNKK